MRICNIYLKSVSPHTDSILLSEIHWKLVDLDEHWARLESYWNKELRVVPTNTLLGCRIILDPVQLANRYPRLIRTMVTCCLLTENEAIGAIGGLRMWGPGDRGSEAVNHAGGSAAVVRHALRCRHHVQRASR
jgi:hypothetical protein